MNAHPSSPSPKVLTLVFAALLGLLALSAASSRVITGPWGSALGLFLAVVKTTLIFVFFMRLRYQTGLVRLFAVAGFFWLSLIGLLTFADYLTRG